MQLLTKKQVAFSEQKSEEEFARFSVEVESKKFELQRSYKLLKDQLETDIEKTRTSLQELILVKQKELDDINNQIKLRKAELEELLKPVEHLIGEWKEKNKELDILKDTLQESITEQDIHNAQLVENIGEAFIQEKKSREKEDLLNKKIKELDTREKSILEKEIQISTITVEMNELIEKLSSKEQELEKERVSFYEYKQKTDKILKERLNNARRTEIYEKQRHVQRKHTI